jgi:hypothetical protein
VCDRGAVVSPGRGMLLIPRAKTRTTPTTLAPLFLVWTLIMILCHLAHAPEPTYVLD